MESIKTVTCLRCKSAVKPLFGALNYPISPIPPFFQYEWGNQKTNKFVCGPMPLIGDFKLVGTSFPVHAFLCSIGFGFEDLKFAIPEYERDDFYTYDTIFATLGISCAGRYYIHYCSDKVSLAIPFPSDKIILPAIKDYVSGPADNNIRTTGNSRLYLFWHGADAATFSTYTNMQSILIARFADEKTCSATNLSVTIATMGNIRSLEAVPLLADNLTICPQVSTNTPGGYTFPAAEALIEIGPAIGYCFGQLEKTKPLSVEESLWLRISHELYPEGLEYDLMRRAETNDLRAARLLGALPWRRLAPDYSLIR